MRLLVNYQLILIAVQPKSISLEQICYKRCQGNAATSLNCLLFSMSKNNDLKRILKSASNVVFALNFLWTSKIVFTFELIIKINNFTGLCSTSQVTEISPPSWLSIKKAHRQKSQETKWSSYIYIYIYIYI